MVRMLTRSSQRITVRGPMRGGAKFKRRRRLDFSAKNKKRNRQRIPPIPQSQRFGLPSPGWKSILSTLGIIYLLGAGPANQTGELIWPAENASPIFPQNATRRFEPVQTSPHLGWRDALAGRGDGLIQNFIADESPVLNEPSQLKPAAKNVPLGQSLFRDDAFDAEAPAAKTLAGPESFKRSRMYFPNLIVSENKPLVMWPAFSSPAKPSGLRWERLALVETGSLGLTIFGFRKFDEFFGGAQKSFRVGNDWSKDRTLHFDELIHFQGGYRITQGLIGMYRWAGLNATWSECLGAGTAASVMTFLEYIDGRRPKPKQGASYSDFTANLLGVSFALAKSHVAALQDVDLRLNYTSFGDIVHKKTLLKYDRMTHWLTYDLQRQWRVPLHVGFGYGVQNAFKPNVRSEIYFGVGLTPVDILERYYPAAAKPLAWLGMYHLGWQVQVK